jgi:hypothetical protein
MTAPSFSRSQAILRLPVDRTPATMYLHDGLRSEVELFLPLAETVLDLLTASGTFLPVMRRDRVCLVARAAIACLAVADDTGAEAGDTVLPVVHQLVQVHLRSGVVLEGELRWLAPQDRRRTGDHLNDGAPAFALHGGGLVHHVIKAHVALVEET